jgi:hypothetical protein
MTDHVEQAADGARPREPWTDEGATEPFDDPDLRS